MSTSHVYHSEMSPSENLHYAFGLMAYAMAYEDGAIQKAEREKFHAIMNAEFTLHDEAFSISDIIFTLMDRRRSSYDRQYTYNRAMHQLRVNSHYLSPALKQTFLSIIYEVAKAFPPVTKGEQSLYEQFKKDIEPLQGDPVYYS